MKKSIKWFASILFLSAFLVGCADTEENPELPAPGQQIPEEGIEPDTDMGE